MISGLTPRQRDCLMSVARLTVDGVSPSVAEIQSDMAMTNRGAVHRLLKALRARGAVDWTPHCARSIRILRQQFSVAELQALETPDLRTLLAHVAGILAHREGGEATFRTLDRVGRRLSGRPLQQPEAN